MSYIKGQRDCEWALLLPAFEMVQDLPVSSHRKIMIATKASVMSVARENGVGPSRLSVLTQEISDKKNAPIIVILMTGGAALFCPMQRPKRILPDNDRVLYQSDPIVIRERLIDGLSHAAYHRERLEDLLRRAITASPAFLNPLTES